MRGLKVFAIIACILCSAGAAVASNLYNKLTPENRVILQKLLVWTGHYPGPLDGDIGPNTIRAIASFQAEIGESPTGILTKNSIQILISTAITKQKSVGYRIVRDDQTGARLGLPLTLVDKSESMRRGTKYSSQQSPVEVETFSLSATERDLESLYKRLSSVANRTIYYSPFKTTWFVLAGNDKKPNGEQREFYMRAHSDGNEIRGYSISFPPGMIAEMRPVIASMSFDFDPFPSASPAVKRKQDKKNKMTFRLDEKAKRIFARGDIVSETDKDFDAFVAANRSKLEPADEVTVVLQSGGGNLVGGMTLGQNVRSNGFSTAVGRLRLDELDGSLVVEPGDCMSACAYAFLGGKKRSVRDQDRLGVHRFHQAERTPDNNPEGLDQIIFGRLLRYVRDMGVDAQLLEAAASAGPNDLRYLRKNELTEWRVVTP